MASSSQTLFEQRHDQMFPTLDPTEIEDVIGDVEESSGGHTGDPDAMSAFCRQIIPFGHCHLHKRRERTSIFKFGTNTQEHRTN